MYSLLYLLTLELMQHQDLPRSVIWMVVFLRIKAFSWLWFTPWSIYSRVVPQMVSHRWVIALNYFHS